MLGVVQCVSLRNTLLRQRSAERAQAVQLVREGDDADAGTVGRAEVRVAHVVRGRCVEPLERGFGRVNGVADGLFDGHVDVRSGREEREAFGDVVLDPG